MKRINQVTKIHKRFRGFLPVVIDIETAGVNPQDNALLELCAVFLSMNDAGELYRNHTMFDHILPFEGAILDQKSLEFNQIDPFQPLRFAVDEKIALERLFLAVRNALKETKCQRAVLVGHNAWFDLNFLKAATKRCQLDSPFHSFTCFDTATLAGLYFGETVLAKAVEAAGLTFDSEQAHSAIYDAEITAELFCKMINHWQDK
ncbi:ribonuclease T [Legionella sp. W05-934-2]|jgi:ribonuclease T|uniref:ribonuclease T n=1 Tax=Legionella sp. W05-934-2 TaxID=1198649 RepID=UPI00346187DB